MTQEIIFKSPEYCLIVWLRQKKHKVLLVIVSPQACRGTGEKAQSK